LSFQVRKTGFQRNATASTAASAANGSWLFVKEDDRMKYRETGSNTLIQTAMPRPTAMARQRTGEEGRGVRRWVGLVIG